MKNKITNILESLNKNIIQAKKDLKLNNIDEVQYAQICGITKTSTQAINKLLKLIEQQHNLDELIAYVNKSMLLESEKPQIINILNNIDEPINEPLESIQPVIKNNDANNGQLIQLQNDITSIKELFSQIKIIDANAISDTVYTRLKQYVDDSNPPAPTDTTSEIDVANFLREFKQANVSALAALETKLSTTVNNVAANVAGVTKQLANFQLRMSQLENNKQSVDDETKLVTSQMVEFTKKANLNKLTENLNIMARYTQNFNLQAGRMCGKIAQLMNVDIRKRAYFIIGSFFFICIASTAASYAVVKLPAPKPVLDAATARKINEYDKMTVIYNNMSTADQKKFARLIQAKE